MGVIDNAMLVWCAVRRVNPSVGIPIGGRHRARPSSTAEILNRAAPHDGTRGAGVVIAASPASNNSAKTNALALALSVHICRAGHCACHDDQDFSIPGGW